MSDFTTWHTDEPAPITQQDIIDVIEDLRRGGIQPTDWERVNHKACKALMQLRSRQQRRWN